MDSGTKFLFVVRRRSNDSISHNYPIDVCNDACSQYMRGIDWRGISEKVKEKDVFYFDVSDALRLFPHLELDEQYALYCYVAHEYHGLWGRVAAVRKDASPDPVNVRSTSLPGSSFELPDTAAPPMEAIYNDGSPFGYFEALLAAELFSAIPYTCFEQERWENCVFFSPSQYETEWKHYIDLPDWRPRFVKDNRDNVSIYACWRHFENSFGSSDGRDQVYLAQHFFYSRLKMYHFFEPLGIHTMYKSQLNDDSRYNEARHCCVASTHHILLAREKQ